MELIAEKLTVVRDGRAILKELSFVVAGGHSLILLGPNGAGKTTLIRTLAGLIPASKGRLWLKHGSPEQSLAEQCHYVGHLNALKANLTVAENARFWERFFGGSGQKTEAALAAFGLGLLNEIPAAYLSAGQKRRLGLARLLLAEKPVWLLDEPAAALDEAAQAALREAVAARLASGGLVVAATHQPLGWPNAQELRLQAAARTQ
jgi:heme exporter protein A